MCSPALSPGREQLWRGFSAPEAPIPALGAACDPEFSWAEVLQNPTFVISEQVHSRPVRISGTLSFLPLIVYAALCEGVYV